MNPNSNILQRQMNNNILPPQSMNTNSGSGLMVGVNMNQGGVPPSLLQNQQGHKLDSIGDHQLASQGNLPSSPPHQGQPPVTTVGGTAPSSTAPSAGGCIIQSTVTMANMKEKTPMCLINELARFNKVQHQYRLVDESGPPHKKTFTVVLKLDNEEYTASGPSIKKAQHAAAAIALNDTTLKHPPPKSQRKAMGPITPTVELNALAMKRGEPAVYQLIEPQRPQYIPNLNFRGMYHQRYHYPKVPTYYVSLKVGSRQFFGEGRTAQAARHAAAEEALTVLRNLPYPENVKRQPEVPLPKTNGESHNNSNNNNNNDDDDDESDDLKSPISLVHEIALKRSLAVNFEVTRESGPPHMRTFVTRCSVGDISTDGEGNGKKVSKKRAAEKMLEELKKLPSLPPAQQKVKKKPIIKKKNRNLIKVQYSLKADPQYGQGINPISRLIQIQQAKKEREPVYTVIEERGEPRQREFIMQCSLGDLSTNGTGPNKKTAKRHAAEAMLLLMGYSRPIMPPGKPSVKPPGMENSHLYPNQEPEKNTYGKHEVEKLDTDGKLGRQLVPGLLLMPEATLTEQNIQNYTIGNSGLNRAPGGPIQGISKMIQTVSLIAKELLETGISPTADAVRKSTLKPIIQHQPLVRPKQKLLFLAEVLGFPVHFTDFPKGNKLEHLCLVSLGINPAQVKHGAGPTMEAAHDQAALVALRSLIDLGMEAVADGKKDNSTNISAAEGLYITGGQGSAPKLTNSPSTDLGSNPKTGSTIPITAKDSH
ncbi:double-stranded RNA-binding protein Staufen homolog 2-like isoform X2 [Uloborus diversus]|uniref:double-stranded RNA-binding protein Staufen homolog 2-like isoform X2 n=1 Tax=Uloborus diversus TaxID=327109 RepID=UPI00240A38DB|nr:double-stranded RNA-binding protein Staufen homolog 2-like isoform X2 [Uloborus diversus]